MRAGTFIGNVSSVRLGFIIRTARQGSKMSLWGLNPSHHGKVNEPVHKIATKCTLVVQYNPPEKCRLG